MMYMCICAFKRSLSHEPVLNSTKLKLMAHYFFLSSQVLGFRVNHPFQRPLTYLCDLEAGYGGVWAPNFGGATPRFEPRTSCLRVRSVTITLRGPPLGPLFMSVYSLDTVNDLLYVITYFWDQEILDNGAIFKYSETL